MKKLCTVLCVLLVLSLLCGCVAHKLELWVEGICLVRENGRVLLIAKDEPIALTDRSKEGHLLKDLQTGDRIRVLHNGIAESFPAQANVYRVERMGQGSLDEVSPQVLDSLRQLGWLE